MVSFLAGVFFGLTLGVYLPTEAYTLAGDWSFYLWGDGDYCYLGDSVFLAADLPFAGVYVLDLTCFLADFGSSYYSYLSSSYSC